ncbi:hypothetical protein RJZ90_005064 [Blastomyces dermatitidis]
MAHLANTATLTVEFNHLASTSKSLALSTSSRPYQAGDERGRTIAETPQGAPGVLPSDDGPEPTQGTASSTTLTISKAKAVMVIITLAGVSFLNTMGSGILIAALPRIAKDVGIPEALILWPAAVYALAAVAIGVSEDRNPNHCIPHSCRCGAAISMCLPTAVSLITNTFPKGTWRNVAFAMNGMGQPLGYAVGLVLGGIFTDTIGWRWAYLLHDGNDQPLPFSGSYLVTAVSCQPVRGVEALDVPPHRGY